MGNPLRDRQTASEWAAARQVIEIEEKLSGFERLASIVEADLAVLDAGKMPLNWRDSTVVGEMTFAFADAQQKVPAVQCELTATVDAVCQRCLEPFQLALETESSLLLLALDETAEGYEDHEVWEMEEDVLRPQDIVEELLIMALPLSARHVDSASCKVLSAAADEQEEMTKPFAALRAQMLED